jgi:MFS family permease
MAFIFFLVLLQSFSISTYESTFPLFARERFGYGAYDMGIIFTIMGVIGVLVQGFLIGKMIKRLGEELVIKIGMALFVLSFFLTIWAFDLWTLALFVSLAVVGQGLMRPSLASLISKDTDLEEGATMGAMQSVDSFGRILGPVMGGALFGLGMSWPYLGNGVLNLLSLLAMLFLI